MEPVTPVHSKRAAADKTASPQPRKRPRAAIPGTAATLRSAVFSEDGRYRYRLDRMWSPAAVDGDEDASRPHAIARHGECNVLLIVGLNPSTADGSCDDPTIRRCLDFAKRWGHTSMAVVNLFAFRSTAPRGLRAADDPVGPANDAAILEAASRASRILCAWGAGSGGTLAMANGRATEVLALLAACGYAPRLCCLKVLQRGQPQHPLYVRKDRLPVPFGVPAAAPPEMASNGENGSARSL